MSETPKFFLLPFADTPAQAEHMYAHFAEVCHRDVPAMAQRIYSITFKHNSEEWIATVGETLEGIAQPIEGRGRQKTETNYPLSDPATVLASFRENLIWSSPTRLAGTSAQSGKASSWWGALGA